MAKCTCVCFVFSYLLFIEVFYLIVFSSLSSVSPKSANIFQRRSTVVLRKKKGDVVIAVPPQFHNYYPRYYPISPIQFYPVPMPMVYRPIVRHHRRRPAHSLPIVEVIDEVTPFYNFIRRHLIPSYIKDLSRIAQMSKKTVYHYHPDHDEESDASEKHKSTMQKPSKSRKAQKLMIYADDPYDSFYYQPQSKIKPKHPILKLRPEEYNAAILEAFSPAWAESSANTSSFLLSENDFPANSKEIPDGDADETQLTYQWLQPSTTKRPKPTLVTSTKPTVIPSLFFRAVDDYSNPIYQHLPLMTKDIRNNHQTVSLPGQNGSSLLFLPVPFKHTALNLSKNQPHNLIKGFDSKLILHPEISTTSTTTTTTASTTTKRSFTGQIPAPVSSPVPVINLKTNQTDNKWKVVPTGKRKAKDFVVASTFPKLFQSVRQSKPKNTEKSNLLLSKVRYIRPIKSRLLNKPIGSSIVPSLVTTTPSMAVTVGTRIDFNQNLRRNKESAADFSLGIDETIDMTTDPDVFEMNTLSSQPKKSKQINMRTNKFPLNAEVKSLLRSNWKPIQTLTTPQPFVEKFSKAKNQSKPFQFNLPNAASSMGRLAFNEKLTTLTHPETEEDIKKLHRVFDELGRVSAKKSKKVHQQTVLKGQSKQRQIDTKAFKNKSFDLKTSDKPMEMQTKFCFGRETGYYADTTSNCKNYYHCTKFGLTKKFKCSLGTIFNEKNMVCDWPRNVQCGK